jgi:hypothetical protein
MSWLEEYGKPTARKVAAAFGGTPRFKKHWDEAEQNSIDILSCGDRPSEGLVSYSTLGLQRHPNVIDGEDIRIELCGIATPDVPSFADVIATIAFYVMKDRWRAAPGITYESMVGMYNLPVMLKHIVFAEPLEWEELSSVDLAGDVVVRWLLVIPISDSELQLKLDKGWDTLEKLFAEKEIDYWDLNRPSVV